MSIRATAFVWDQSTQTGAALLMLLAVADHANDDGICWPSIARLAEKARVSERQAQRLIQQLETAGDLQILDRGNGRGKTSLYILKRYAATLKGDTAMSPFDTRERVTSCAGKGDILGKKGDISREKGDTAMSPEPSLTTTVIEPSTEPTTTTDSARANPAPSSSSKSRGESGRSAARAETRPEPGAVQHRQPQDTVTDKIPPSPLAAPPSPTPAADGAQVAAVAAALADGELCADGEEAGRQALALLAEFPADWVIAAALQTAAKPRLNDPIAYLRGTLRNWRREGRRQAPTVRGELTEEGRRRKYTPQLPAAPAAVATAATVAQLDPAPAVDADAGGKNDTVSFLDGSRQQPTPAHVSQETPDPHPAVAAVAAALQRAGAAGAASAAAQLVATFPQLGPAQLVGTIDAAAAKTPGKAPSILGIRGQLRQLCAAGAN